MEGDITSSASKSFMALQVKTCISNKIHLEMDKLLVQMTKYIYNVTKTDT